mmetsp:Transcript_10292/g.26825  ORF Transcript_10292/g.26825 Transcript_10292/m.26825 type:complete len:344 (+) Transcript_10292:93-1124(+)
MYHLHLVLLKAALLADAFHSVLQGMMLSRAMVLSGAHAFRHIPAWEQRLPSQAKVCPCLARFCAQLRRRPARHACFAHLSNSSLPSNSWHPQHSGQQPKALVPGARGGGRVFRSPWNQKQPLLHRVAVSSNAREGERSGSGGQDENSMVLNLPTILTIGRVAAIPFLVAAWYWPSPWSTPAVTSLFIAASITDWLDGYLARKMNSTSKFGAFLDPVADKLMVSTLLVLMSTQPIPTGPLAGVDWLGPVCTMVIIGREITISALREWAATLGSAARGVVAVNNMGKWKTAAQMTSLTLLLIARDGSSSNLGALASTAGPALLVVSAYLTLSSMVAYLRALWRFM